MVLEKYSIGIGDRFGHQGNAQLQAFLTAKQLGVDVVPVWNKSNREHIIIGTNPEDTRREADAAVKKMGWKGAYHVDADHIGLGNVDKFMAYSDFFTLDVADFIGKAPVDADLHAFEQTLAKYIGKLNIPGVQRDITVTEDSLHKIGAKYLYAIKEAAKTYQHIKKNKGEGKFIVEVSMDETDAPQTPVEMFFILAAIALEGIPAQTIAPKFSGTASGLMNAGSALAAILSPVFVPRSTSSTRWYSRSSRGWCSPRCCPT